MRIDLTRMEAHVPPVEEGGEPEVFHVRRVRMDGVEEEPPVRTRRTWGGVEGAAMQAARWRFRSVSPAERQGPARTGTSGAAVRADNDDAVLDALLERVRIRREEMRRAVRVSREDAEEQRGDTRTPQLRRALSLGQSSVGRRGEGERTRTSTGVRDDFRLTSGLWDTQEVAAATAAVEDGEGATAEVEEVVQLG